MAMAEIDSAPSRRSVLILTATALAAATLILFAGILPAEYHRDPTGLGRLLGTAALWAPAEQVIAPQAGGAAAPAARSFPHPFRSDVIEIPLTASGDPDHGDEVEYKVHLTRGASYVYAWQVSGIADPEEFYTEFHGHTLVKGAAMTVAYYRKATGIGDNGVLTAPFDGVHGWYFQNQSVTPVTVRLHLSGFYDLIPAGQPGNERGFSAKRVE